jgi:putative aldouronate transport system substrate-binding protein
LVQRLNAATVLILFLEADRTMDNNRWTKWVNENKPNDVKYVAVPRFESLQKLNVLFASGFAPDLIFEYDTAYQGQL